MVGGEVACVAGVGVMVTRVVRSTDPHSQLSRPHAAEDAESGGLFALSLVKLEVRVGRGF